MPVYDLTYRSYEGKLRRRFRWAVVAEQELAQVTRTRLMRYLLILCVFHFLMRIIQVAMYDSMAADPRSPIGMAVRTVSFLNVDNRMFFDFIRWQGLLVFLISVVGGAGLIANDSRHNLLEVYFAKPLTWRDYVLGKLATLLVLGLGATAAPALFLIVLHNILAPSLDTLQKSAWWAVDSIAFSAALVVPLALLVLACSALSRGERQAGLAVTLLLFINWFFSNMLADLLHNRNILILSLPTAIRRIGEIVFEQHRPAMDLPWYAALTALALVSALALAIVVRKARRAERSV